MNNKKIQILGAFWELTQGGHPLAANKNDSFFSFSPFYDSEAIEEHIEELNLPLIPAVSGHNLIVDDTIQSLVDIAYQTPTSPIFARDLCGRIVYLGYGPEIKMDDQWLGEGQRVTFPKGCHALSGEQPESELIDNVFFTKFRCLDMSEDYPTAKARATDPVYAGSYQKTNLYPYKLRLDTFYIDGWKLPQTNMVFAKNTGILPSDAEQTANDFMKRWQERDTGQSYEQFYEKNLGDTWYEDLFSKGCTIIPTIEACNGYNQISPTFDLVSYHAGRAVDGLHEVIEEKNSAEPKGTILKVVEPGYVLPHKVHPAKVVISNGSKFKELENGDPHPLMPDLTLPHQRTTSTWGAVWVPTHPSHFKAPAIWGWEGGSGRFLQLEGPIWDPLHYYYESVDLVVRAHKTPLEGNNKLALVPEEMKLRFYPVTTMKGFDVFSPRTKKARKEAGVLPKSGIRRAPFERATCSIGYHPLPLQFEYELDSWWFAELSPKNRVEKTSDPLILKRLADPIECRVSIHDYLDVTADQNETERLTRPGMLADTSKNALKDYPQLKRYKADTLSFEDIIQLAPIEISDRTIVKKDSSREREEIVSIVKETGIPFYKAMLDVLDMQTDFLDMRDRLSSKKLGFYILSWWESIPFYDIDALIQQSTTQQEEEAL